MHSHNIIRKVLFIALALTTTQASIRADVIEHIGDRYIINVDEMELNGDETVLDLLMMCPEIMSQNGRTTSSVHYMGYYAIRINNIDIQTDEETFLKNTKANELKCIKLCVNPGVMKGSGDMKKVIDLYFRKDRLATHGKVTAEADWQTSGELFGRIIHQNDKVWIQGMAVGKMQDINDTQRDCENANVNVDWNISPNDNLLLQAAQTYGHLGTSDNSHSTREHMASAKACYTRTLSDNGAYALVQTSIKYSDNKEKGISAIRTASPSGLVECGFPFIHKNLYATAGIEAGYNAEKNCLAEYTDKEMYQDEYIQLDWTCGKWSAMIGDRFHSQHFWLSQMTSRNDLSPWEHTNFNNYFTISVWCNIDKHNILQATTARRFYSTTGNQYIIKTEDGKREFTTDIFQCPIYVSEVRYTYQQHNFNVMSFIKNEHKKIDTRDSNDDILTVGASAFFHAGILRLTAGIDYNWEEFHYHTYGTKHSHWVSCHIAPQVSLPQGWRFTANAIYNSRRMDEYIPYLDFYQQPNCYADIAASKQIGRHWLIKARWHDIADNHMGTHAMALSATYTF